jgi:hypothetical protein
LVIKNNAQNGNVEIPVFISKCEDSITSIHRKKCNQSVQEYINKDIINMIGNDVFKKIKYEDIVFEVITSDNFMSYSAKITNISQKIQEIESKKYIAQSLKGDLKGAIL